MALETINEWAQRVVNTKVWDPRVPGATTAQCTYLWRDFLQKVVGAPWEAGVAASVGTTQGSAYQLWTQFGLRGGNDNTVAPQWLEKVAFAAGAQRGDAVIWPPHSGWTFSDGHVAIVDEQRADGSLVVWSQNDQQDSPTRRLHLTGVQLAGIYGFLRPKKFIINIKENDDMIIVKNTATSTFYSIGQQFIRHIPTEAEAQYVCNILTAEDKIVFANATQFTQLLAAHAIPASRATLVTTKDGGGRFWSREQSLMDAVQGVNNDGVAGAV